MRVNSRSKRIISIFIPTLAFIASMIVGCILILLAQKNPLEVYANLLRSAFSFSGFNSQSALLTTFQFSVPLILSGLSTTVAFRAKFISLGQLGQMLFGAAVAAWLGSRINLPPVIHSVFALTGGALAGAFWGWVPAILKVKAGSNEVLVTLILNPIAVLLVGMIHSSNIAESAQLLPLVQGTKLSAGFIIALFAALVIYVYIWHMSPGYEQRMAGDAPGFANYGGISANRSILRAMLISGALAGLAGGVEVLGVYYHFVTSFSAVTEFDGIIVGLLGLLHPLGVVLAGIFLGGLRAGAIVGLQIQSGVPRELGSLLIAITILILANERLFKEIIKKIVDYLIRLNNRSPNIN